MKMADYGQSARRISKQTHSFLLFRPNSRFSEILLNIIAVGLVIINNANYANNKKNEAGNQ